MRVVVGTGHPAVTREVMDALAGVAPVTAVEGLHEALTATRALPESVLVAVWPRIELGRERTRRLLGSEVDVPVVAIIDPQLRSDRQALTESGAVYLPLPLVGAELVASVQRFVSGRRSPRRWLGDLCVDVEQRTVQRGGAHVDLSRKEFDLLAFLVGHPRRVFSRHELLEEVWGSPDYTLNSVEVAVSSLRRKLEALGPRVIHTVRGVGYVCRPPVERSELGASELLSKRRQVVAERDALVAQREALLERIRSQRAIMGSS